MGALFVFYGISEFLNDIYVDENAWSHVLWHYFYEDNGRIENLYLGSSHVFCDLNPTQLDELNGKYNFNLASSGQRLNGSYYLLREADEKNDLSHVYLELYYWCSTKDLLGQDPIEANYYYHWNNTDSMRMSYQKLGYIFSFLNFDNSLETFFPFTRYRTRLDDWKYIKEILEKKNSEAYLSYKYQEEFRDGNGYEEYLPQGYFYTSRIFLDEQRLYWQERILEKEPIGEKSEQYLRKIICYCQKRGIPITLFQSPVDELQLISTGEYDNYTAQIRRIAEEYGVDFYDFNLTKEEYLPIHQGGNFRDVGHLNYAGAAIFTDFFHEVVSREADKNGEYFYASYAEKLKEQPPAIYGLYYRESETEEETPEENRVYWIASNRAAGMEYRILVTPDEGRQRTIQDFAENSVFELPKAESGICTIVARMKEQPDEVQTLEINY